MTRAGRWEPDRRREINRQVIVEQARDREAGRFRSRDEIVGELDDFEVPSLPESLRRAHQVFTTLPRDMNGGTLHDQHKPALRMSGLDTSPLVLRRYHRLFIACDAESAAIRSEEREVEKAKREASRGR